MRILLVDDAVSLIRLYATSIEQRLGHRVVVVHSPAEAMHLWDPPGRGRDSDAVSDPFDLAIVDLAFPRERDTGLSALHFIHSHSPQTRLGVLTQGDVWTEAVLRDAWELLPLRLMLSKGVDLDKQMESIRRILQGGEVEVDPVLRPLLPASVNTWRTPQSFRRLVCHQGHAKLWRALMDATEVPTYLGVARECGLSINTIKNYRTQLLGELEFHGLEAAGLSEMREFAQRCRPFLEPYLLTH